MFHLERWGVFLHPGLKIMGLTDLIFDVALMIIVVGEGVIHLCWREMRKLAQHFFDSEAEFMVPDDRTNRETGATNDGTTTTDSLFTFDVRVGCFCRSYVTHTESSPRTLPRGFPPRKPASFPDSSYAKREEGQGWNRASGIALLPTLLLLDSQQRRESYATDKPYRVRGGIRPAPHVVHQRGGRSGLPFRALAVHPHRRRGVRWAPRIAQWAGRQHSP